MKIVITFLTLLIFNLQYCNCSAKKIPPLNAVKILFLGSSYFNYNDLPGIVKALADSSGKALIVDQYIPGGLFLDDHAASSITDSLIKKEDWDLVILQGVGLVTAYPDDFTTHKVFPAMKILRDKIAANFAYTQIYFCLPWAYEDGMAWKDGWTDLFDDMQIKIYNNSLKYADNLGIRIAPVGWAWYRVLQEKNYPLHYLHTRDWNHPSMNGSYLTACVIYSSIFQEECTDIPHYGGLEEGEAKYFQTVATNTVMKDLDLWNIPEIAVNIRKESDRKFSLLQNYPNPFTNVTSITYRIGSAGHTEISVYDMFGKKITSMINNFQIPGEYRVRFDGQNIPDGLYYYTLKFGNEFLSGKMVRTNPGSFP